MTPKEICSKLLVPFAPEDLEWRLQLTTADRKRGLAVPYVTNRAIQNRLDDVAGPENWCNEYKPWHGSDKKAAQLCGISIYFESRGWITKWDGAEDSDMESVKGGLSDSMKRAAVQWGIGRVLYNIDTVWVEVEERKKDKFIIKESERPKLDKAYLAMLKKLGLTPAPACGIKSLLTPSDTAEPLSNVNSDAGKSKTSEPPVDRDKAKEPQNPSPKLTPMPTPAPAYEYIVRGVKVQMGMNGSSTQLRLEDAQGRQANAFARGVREDLKEGVTLTNVKLTRKQQDTVVFYILESYEVIQPMETAA